jgi:2-polyprenyl-3-methyl-5-hydroxy-6-metoxy-1,4-benzoquinol methylase
VKSNSEIASDFDRIARVLGTTGNRELSASERALLRNVPVEAQTALEVGCGDGSMARALTRRVARVTALDLSPEMIGTARRRRTPSTMRITYALGDFMTVELPLGGFEVVTCINVLHHLSLPAAVARLAALVSAGGRLLIQDIVARPGLRYLPTNLAGGITRIVQRVVRRSAQEPREVRDAYEAHGRGEVYLTPEEADLAYGLLLPGARVMHHVEWRYSVVWSPRRLT